MASEDYNEEDWESLSDVETALDNIGIKLRENANTYRDTETILNEIAEKWDTLDETSQNSVVSALAGTRQRVNNKMLRMYSNIYRTQHTYAGKR